MAERQNRASQGAVRIRAAGRLLGEAVLETLWPTRCAVCDAPGELLCDACRLHLPYLDWWRACHRCGAPFGTVQCCTCHPVMLARLGRSEPPFDACASAVMLDGATGRVATLYKDGGERRLAGTMAGLMASAVPPEWRADAEAVTFVPATAAAVRRRGFDHAELLAGEVAARLGRPCARLLARPSSRDQRQLTRRGRFQNTEGRFTTLAGASAPRSMLLVDDVYTTGATLFAATDALRAAGAVTVYCLTFARAW